jgi:hypothetical protein
MNSKAPDETYSPAETKRRMEDALRRALNTPPKTHAEMTGKRDSTPESRRPSYRRKEKTKA